MAIASHWKSITLLCLGAPVVCYSIWYLIRSRSRKIPETPIGNASKSSLDQAIGFKNRGNKFFKALRYEEAIECYSKAIDCCPESAVSERATFYQNRAAANENLKNLEAALADVNTALELSPKYLKALNRRAHLYEKLDRLEECLVDVTGCCIFEQFRNTENVLCVDRVLKRLGQKKAKEEYPKLPRELPSESFIRSYLGAFSWNPFTLDDNDNPLQDNQTESPSSVDKDTPANGLDANEVPANEQPSQDATTLEPNALGEESLESSCNALSNSTSEVQEREVAINVKPVVGPDLVVEAMTTFASAIKHLENGDFEKSMKMTNKAGELFSKAKQEMLDALSSMPHWLTPALRASATCHLLRATYLALCGRAEEAADMLNQLVKANPNVDGMAPSSVVKTNAYIKAACLAMTVNQDLASCLFNFHSAQELCPDCPDVYVHRGQIHLLADQFEEAYHDLNRAVQLKPEFSVAKCQCCYTIYRRALANQDEKAAEDAVHQFAKLVDRFPNCQETHSLYAQVLTERGEFEKADAEFSKVITLAPNSGLAYAHRGLLQLRWRQDRDAAAKLFNQGVDCDPKCELIHELSGQLAVERGQFEVALQHFDAAIRQSKTLTDLAHLMSLRDGVLAQMTACQRYGVSIPDLLQTMLQDEKQAMIQAAAAAAFAAASGGNSV